MKDFLYIAQRLSFFIGMAVTILSIIMLRRKHQFKCKIFLIIGIFIIVVSMVLYGILVYYYPKPDPIATPTGAPEYASLEPSVFTDDSMREVYLITYKGKEMEIPCRISVPDGYGIHQYPTLLYIHNSRWVGNDNEKHVRMDFLNYLTNIYHQTYPAIIVAPQFPREYIDASYLANDKEFLSGIMSIVEQIQNEYNANPNRLYVIGDSMGGDAVWSLAEYFPDRIAAAAPVCGTTDNPNVEKLKEVPLWAFHGEWDLTYQAKKIKKVVENVKAAGGNVRYTGYARRGHGIWDKAYSNAELLQWMFSQSKANS